ncbi:cellulose biosynthesis cyclic di-GMP-binding regulatory protein BcsB [Shigella flexneri]
MFVNLSARTCICSAQHQIDMDLKYRYTMPAVKDSSRMDISLNNQFLQSFSLVQQRLHQTN